MVGIRRSGTRHASYSIGGGVSEQPLDLRRSMQIVRRHKAVVATFAALGLLAGVGYGVVRPPMLTSSALVALPPSIHDTATQVVVASSERVLADALRNIHPVVSLPTLRSRVQTKSVTFTLISISAQGKTAAQAEGTANAVANSYIAYVNAEDSAAGKVHAQLLQRATTPSGKSQPVHLLVTGGFGALLGLLIGVIVALAISRRDGRLRGRDEIANAIGVPVLASLPVAHPTDAGRWARLLEDYAPDVVHAWQLRNALRYLGQADAAMASNGDGFSVTVLSLSSDRGALALGPQLAVFAASLGIPTALVIGPQEEPEATVTAALRTACATPQSSPRRSDMLRVAVADHRDVVRQPGAKFIVVVAVVDAQTPRVADTMRTGSLVLAVSAGAVTAAELASVAVSAAVDGRQVDGILVADPDRADQTTGRVPQLGRPAHRRMPTRLTGTMTETRR